MKVATENKIYESVCANQAVTG